MTTLLTVTSFISLCSLLERHKNHHVQFLQSEQFLASNARCGRCKKFMLLEGNSHCKLNQLWRCRKCRKTKGICVGTFFEQLHVEIDVCFHIIFCWAAELDARGAACMTGQRPDLINQMYEYCRDICTYKIIKAQELFVLGGPGIIVQIDESVFAHRKHNKGRIIPGSQKWVLGILDTSTGRVYLRLVEDRSAATLIPIIQAHVHPGSEIWTDLWKAYSTLGELGYVHKTVNHTENFVDPTTGCCTNAVEGMWAVTKRKLRRLDYMRGPNVCRHLDTIMWRQIYGATRLDAFRNIIRHIRERYPQRGSTAT